MPLVTITLRKGHPPEFLTKVGTAIQEALTTKANVPAADHFQIFHELDSAQIHADPTFAGGTRTVERSDDLIIIQIILNTGRTDEIKSALYADIAARLNEYVEIRPDDVFINLVEVAKQNWSMASGLMTYPT